MSPRSTIFISAVSKELKSARELVANTLTFLGADPVWQDIFGTEQGDLREMLHRQIDECQGVVQLVGKRYGAEPPTIDEPFGRVSYTQYEALYAEKRGKKVWYLVLDEDFPVDNEQPESDELHELQAAYRQRLRTGPTLCYSVGSLEALEVSVIKLRNDLVPLRSRVWRLTDLLGRRGEQADAKMARSETLERKERVQPVRDEDVQFSAYRPRTMYVGKWHTWLTFAYRGPGGPDEPDPAIEVERQARATLGAEFDDDKYVEARQESAAALPRESTITIIPEVTGLKFNPPQRSFIWQEPVHREEFRASASPDSVDQTLRGKITVFLGALVLAEINVKVVVASAAEAPTNENLESKKPLVSDRARVYRKIFASYSRRDHVVVDHLEKLAAALGDRYSRDIHEIRAGEIWSHRLEEMIREADIFQLFWSSNSMRSKYVRQEWEYALALGRPNFIRPTYWESPMPSDSSQSLPPASLRSLHFQRIPIASHDGPVLEPALAPRARSSALPSRPLKRGARKGKKVAIGALSMIIFFIGLSAWTLQQKNDTAADDARNKGVAGMSLGEGRSIPASVTLDWAHWQRILVDEEARYREAIKLQEEELGPEHPDTLRSRNSLADTLHALGKYTDAAAEYRDVLKLREKMLGPQHVDTLQSRNSLANTLCDLGKYAEAGTEYLKVIELQERMLGPENPDVLKSRNKLAETLREQAKYADAEAEHRAVLKLRERVLGPEHRDTLGSRNSLAWTLVEAGKYAEAEQEIRPTLEIIQRNLGPKDLLALAGRDTLGESLRGQGKFPEAVSLFREALIAAEDTLGTQNPITIEIAYHLALCLKAEGHLTSAKEFAQRAAEGASKGLGANHPDTVKYEKLWQELQAKK